MNNDDNSTPPVVRTVIDSIRSTKTSFTHGSPAGTPYRGSTSSPPPAADARFETPYHRASTSSAAYTASTTSTSSMSSSATQVPPAAPPSSSATDGRQTNTRARMQQPASPAARRQRGHRPASVFLMLLKLRRSYERLFLAHAELFASIENLAGSVLFLVPGSMRDVSAEIGDEIVSRSVCARVFVAQCKAQRTLVSNWSR
jgi:hypothetical protein